MLGRLALAAMVGAGDGVAWSVELSWTGPAGCPAPAHVLARIDELRASTPAARAAAERVSARAVVTRPGADAFALELTLTSPTGSTTRTLTASSCAVLAEATAFAVMMVLDAPPVAPPQDAPPQDAPPQDAPPQDAPPRLPAPPVAPLPVAPLPVAPKRSPPSSSPSAPSDASPPATPARRRPLAWLGFAGGIESGALPRVAGAVLGRVALGWPWVELGARGVVLPERDFAVATTTAIGHVASWTLGLDVAAVIRLRRLEIALGTLAEAGIERARTTGLRIPGLARRPWIAVGARAELRVHLLPWLDLSTAFEPVVHRLTPWLGTTTPATVIAMAVGEGHPDAALANAGLAPVAAAHNDAAAHAVAACGAGIREIGARASQRGWRDRASPDHGFDSTRCMAPAHWP